MKLAIEQIELLHTKLKGNSFSIFTNSSTVNTRYKDSVSILFDEGLPPKSILGPQHGFTLDKQDNMKESVDSIHSIYRIPIYSLYGETREPREYMLKDVDLIVIDIQDVGSRYYTYISSIFYILQSAKNFKKKVLVLDRPNPIGNEVEGNLVSKDFKSFVGIYPIPNRHGLTVGELASMFNKDIGAELDILKIKNHDPQKYWDELDPYTWVPSSPNMPRFETSIVYPGQCLLEATNISEGRGTTTPFEIFGAPFIKHKDFLNSELINTLEGVIFRPISFVPTFNKYKGQLCNGFFIHITDRKVFRPLKTTLAIIYTLYHTYKEFSFTDPPYEYEYHKLPIDILMGSDSFRKQLIAGASFSDIYEELNKDVEKFKKIREEFLIY